MKCGARDAKAEFNCGALMRSAGRMDGRTDGQTDETQSETDETLEHAPAKLKSSEMQRV